MRLYWITTAQRRSGDRLCLLAGLPEDIRGKPIIAKAEKGFKETDDVKSVLEAILNDESMKIQN
jgi:hypothetical protein